MSDATSSTASGGVGTGKYRWEIPVDLFVYEGGPRTGIGGGGCKANCQTPPASAEAGRHEVVEGIHLIAPTAAAAPKHKGTNNQ